ncbi:hypothetical protein [Actinacidiphila glaucinigra]|uniref:hypothetical protein n=1 Tax=Actinacidiphila glaucinigra TaxID=235986 RepID=UPI003D940209
MVASGGQGPWFFLDTDLQKRDATPAAWHLTVNDKRLRQLVADARSDMAEAWAWAGDSQSPRDIREQTDVARRGVGHIDRALTRIGELSRTYG